MTCANCGAEVTPGASFCTRCGAAVGAVPGGAAERTTEGAPSGPRAYPPPAPGDVAAPAPGIPPHPSAPAPGGYGIPPYPTEQASPYSPWTPAPPPPPYGAYSAAGRAAVGPTGSRIAPFGAPLAGWWQRVGSLILDALVLGIPFGILQIVVIAAFGQEHDIVTTEMVVPQRTLSRGTEWTFVLFFFIVQAIYFSFLNGRGRGQTPGNRAPGIAVRDLDTGEAIGAGRGFLRWFVRFFLYAALIIPGILNDLYPLWDARSQTLADKAARSVMIRV